MEKSIIRKLLVISQAFILCLAMMFTAIPQESYAASIPEIHISSVEEWEEMWFDLYGTTVKIILDGDITVDEGKHLDLQGVSGVLDLNGHSIKSTSGENYCVVNIDTWDEFDPTITITGNGTIGYDSDLISGSAVEISGKSTVTIKNCTFSGYYGISASGQSTVTIDGGSFSGMYTVYGDQDSSITINNGSFKSKFVESDSEFDESIAGGWHNCLYDATENGELVVNGGTFDSTGASMGVIQGTHATINGGTFKGGCPAINANDYVDGAYLFINGGDFTGCTDFFFADDVMMDGDHLKAGSEAKLTTRQRNQISMAIARANAGSGEDPIIDPDPDPKPDPDPAPSVTPAPSKPVNYSPAKAVIRKVKAGKKNLNVKWKKVANASGYNIQVARDKKFTKSLKSATVKKYTSKGKTIKKLKKGKKYYVRVRAYRVVNGKTYYGAWSKAKSTKVK